MKKIGIPLLILASTLFVFSGIRDELHWYWVAYSDRTADYAGYLAAWPDGRHAAEAKGRNDARAWHDTQQAKTPASYEAYLTAHPAGQYEAQARTELEALRWRTAQQENNPKSYQAYLARYPGGQYVAQAREQLEGLLWDAAQKENTVVALQGYLEAYPAGRWLKDATDRRKALLQDDAPYLKAKKQGSKEAYGTFLAEFPGHKREADARSALKDMEGRDIVDLLAEKKLEAEAEGSGIEGVSLRIRRRVNHELRVRIPVGTFFVSRNPAAQNMVTRSESSLLLTDDQWIGVHVAAACANRPRDIPGNDDRFQIQRAPQQKELQLLMPVVERAGVPFAVQQAAVWIITDNASYGDLGILVSGFGGFGPRVIQEQEVAQAMRIIDTAGIDIRKKAIWRDRKEVLGGLADEDLKSWLTQLSTTKK